MNCCCMRRYVSFLSACFGPVFFSTYEECKALINLSGSPQGHPLFDIFATQCCMHVAHCHSTHAKAFTLLKFYRHTHPSIHSPAIIPSHSSIIISRTHPGLVIHHCAHSIYAPTGKGQCARVRARSHKLALSRVHTVARPSS